MGLHSELPAAGPRSGPGAVCRGGPRSRRQKWLRGAVHSSIDEPAKRCSYTSPPCTYDNTSSSWYLVCNVWHLPPQGIDMFTYWRQMVPVCLPPHSSSMSKWPAKEPPSKVCLSVWPSPKARHDVRQIRAAFSDNKGLWKMRGGRERGCCCCCCQCRPQVVQFTLIHFPVQGKTRHVSKMKRHAGS